MRIEILSTLNLIEQAWLSNQGCQTIPLDHLWPKKLKSALPTPLQNTLKDIFQPLTWPQDLKPNQRKELLLGRTQLWKRLMSDLKVKILPAKTGWHTNDVLKTLPDTLCLSLPRLGVSVYHNGVPYLCTEREMFTMLKKELIGYQELFINSVLSHKPFKLIADDQEGSRVESLILCLLNTPAWLLLELHPLYRSLFEIKPLLNLSARAGSLYDDLALHRDLSLKRTASADVQAARGWLQIGMSAMATHAERKARIARARGGSHTITPHHLAFDCPIEHPLWHFFHHCPRTHEGRALAIREALRSAIKVKPGSMPNDSYHALLAPIKALPPPLAWQIICSTQSIIAHSHRTRKRSTGSNQSSSD